MANRNSPRRKREPVLATQVEVMYDDEPGPAWLWNPQPREAAYAALTGFEAACELVFGHENVHVHQWQEDGVLCALVDVHLVDES